MVLNLLRIANIIEADKLSTINLQLSTFNYQLSTINFQLSTFNHQLSTYLHYTETLKSLKASFKLVFKSVEGLRCPIINAQPTPYSPAGNFLL